MASFASRNTARIFQMATRERRIGDTAVLAMLTYGVQIELQTPRWYPLCVRVFYYIEKCGSAQAEYSDATACNIILLPHWSCSDL